MTQSGLFSHLCCLISWLAHGTVSPANVSVAAEWSRPLAGSCCSQEALLRIQQVKAFTVNECVWLLPQKHNNNAPPTQPGQSVHSATMYILYLFQVLREDLCSFCCSLSRGEKKKLDLYMATRPPPSLSVLFSLFCFYCVVLTIWKYTSLKVEITARDRICSHFYTSFLVVSFPGVVFFLMGRELRKWRIVNGDIIYTCTWWFSYIFIAYQKVLHLTRGYKVSQSSAWS